MGAVVLEYPIVGLDLADLVEDVAALVVDRTALVVVVAAAVHCTEIVSVVAVADRLLVVVGAGTVHHALVASVDILVVHRAVEGAVSDFADLMDLPGIVVVFAVHQDIVDHQGGIRIQGVAFVHLAGGILEGVGFQAEVGQDPAVVDESHQVNRADRYSGCYPRRHCRLLTWPAPKDLRTINRHKREKEYGMRKDDMSRMKQGNAKKGIKMPRFVVVLSVSILTRPMTTIVTYLSLLS